MTGKNLIIYGTIGIALLILIGTFTSCDNDLITDDPYFINDGTLVTSAIAKSDPTKVFVKRNYIEEGEASKIKFYIEVSGSMNGFLRANLPTGFKKQVWSVFSNFSDWSDGVYVLSNSGTITGHCNLGDFRNMMNAGAFISTAETKVDKMITSILNDIDVQQGEAAVLVSDMKYSPEGSKDMGVLISQFEDDIRNAVGEHKASYCLIAAVSNYLDKNGCSLADISPYYYFIIGNTKTVMWLRNHISILLEHNNAYVDAMEWGMNYKSMNHDFGIPMNAVQMIGQPTFYNAIEPCTINLNIDITNYRWLLSNKECFVDCFKVSSNYGSNVKLESVTIVDDHNYKKQPLKRHAVAQVKLSISGMIADADVIEWKIELPESLVIEDGIHKFFGAKSEHEYDKTFLIDSFVGGMFKGTSNEWDTIPNRILISTK